MVSSMSTDTPSTHTPTNTPSANTDSYSAATDSHSVTDGRIAFVQSNWHDDIVDQARIGFVQNMPRNYCIDFFDMPGAFEIPLLAQRLAKTGSYDAIVAAGLVVDGGIYRHDFVADAVISGLMRIQLDTGVPIFSVVLTPLQFHEHQAHSDFFTAHMVEKGREAASACLATLKAHSALRMPSQPPTQIPVPV